MTESGTPRVIVVTGAGAGLGAAICDAAAGEGATVIGIDQQASANVAASRFFKCDLSDPVRTESVVHEIIDQFGHIDVAFNNAGVGGGGLGFLDITLADWDRVMGINARGAFFFAQQVARHMVSRGSGVIINTTSQLSVVAGASGAHYVSSKGALLQLTRAMAVELAPHGVRVNALAPGIMSTQMTEKMRMNEDWVEERGTRIPMGRLGEPAEVAAAAMALADPRLTYLTGTSLFVDGGYTAW